MVNFSDFKVNDVIGLVVCDYAEGEAYITGVSEDKLSIRWIYRTPCYSGTYFANEDGVDEILREDVENGNVFDLELIERRKNRESPWFITETQINELVSSYQNNKEELRNLEDFIQENGETNDGLSDPSESFEQGYNNALELVFRILGIEVN